MLNFLKRLALIGATGAVAATSLVGVTVPAQAASAGWAVALAAVPPATTVGSSVTLDAVASQNVGPTPYYIEIFDENGTRIAACGTGTTCSVSYTPSGRGSNLIAFVSGYSSALPPTSIQASSNAVHTVYERLT